MCEQDEVKKDHAIGGETWWQEVTGAVEKRQVKWGDRVGEEEMERNMEGPTGDNLTPTHALHT